MYNPTTWNIANALATDATLRDRVIAWLQDMRKPEDYSGQRFDQKQDLASFLHSVSIGG